MYYLGLMFYTMSGFGITAGAHRYWAHKAYKAKTPLRLLLAYMQTVAFQVSRYIEQNAKNNQTKDMQVNVSFTVLSRIISMNGVGIIVSTTSSLKLMLIHIMQQEDSSLLMLDGFSARNMMQLRSKEKLLTFLIWNRIQSLRSRESKHFSQLNFNFANKM